MGARLLPYGVPAGAAAPKNVRFALVPCARRGGGTYSKRHPRPWVEPATWVNSIKRIIHWPKTAMAFRLACRRQPEWCHVRTIGRKPCWAYYLVESTKMVAILWCDVTKQIGAEVGRVTGTSILYWRRRIGRMGDSRAKRRPGSKSLKRNQ